MSTVNGKKLKAAAMHANVFYPGVGEIKKELSSTPSGTNPGVDMVIDEPFVLLTTRTKNTNKAVTIPVPITNFAYTVLADE